MPFVIDSSVALASVLPDEDNSSARAVLLRSDHDMMVVPIIWPLEVLNGILSAVRRGRMAESALPGTLDALLFLPVHADAPPDDHALRTIMRLGRKYQLTAYDASYIECAARNEIPFATLDKRLRAAAIKQGIDVLL